MATVKKKAIAPKVLKNVREFARQATRLPAERLWLDFDQEADVVYLSLKRPQKATRTVFLDDQGVLLRYRNKELVGITVLDASKK